MIKLAPSILSANFANLGEDIRKVEEAGAEFLHIDVMDGVFVPSISFGMPVIKSIRKVSNLFFDVHLMINNPDDFIEEFAKAGADNITVHVETCKHLNRTISKIKELGVKASVSLNPATSLSVLDYILEDVDMVLLMTVNPGFGGQSFLPNSIDKIKKLRAMAIERQISLDIQVDGGINEHNLNDVVHAGATVIVAGTSIFAGNIDENIKRFKSIITR